MFSNIEADIPEDNQASESHREVPGLEQRSRLWTIGHGSLSPKSIICWPNPGFLGVKKAFRPGTICHYL
jgi:hypothetical protein